MRNSLRVGIIGLTGSASMTAALQQLSEDSRVVVTEIASLDEAIPSDEYDIIVANSGSEKGVELARAEVEETCKRIMQKLICSDDFYSPRLEDFDLNSFEAEYAKMAREVDKNVYRTMAFKNYHKRNEFLLAKAGRKQSRKIKSGRRLARSKP